MRCLLFLLPGLGDALVASPIVDGAARAGWRLDVAVMLEPVAEFARALPGVENVEFFDLMAGQSGALPAALHLRRRKYDVAVLPFPAARWQYHALAFASGAKRLFAHDYGGIARIIDRAAGAHLVQLAGGHRIWENVRLARAAGLTPSSTDYLLPPAWHSGRQIHGLLGVHPGSMRYKGNDRKRWPVQDFAQLIRRSVARGRAVRLFIGPSEHELARQIGRAVAPSAFEIIDMPLDAAVRALSECEVFVGNDAGFAHVAAGLGVKTIVLYGMTDPRRSQPVGPSVALRPSSCPPCHDEGLRSFDCALRIGYRCIQSDLGLETVCDAVERAFSESPTRFVPAERADYRLYGRLRASAVETTASEPASQISAQPSDSASGT